MPKKIEGNNILNTAKDFLSNKGVVVAVSVAAVGAALIFGYGYYISHNKSIAIGMGSSKVGVYFDPETGEPQVTKGEHGCCTPYCSEMFEIECSREFGIGVAESQFYPGKSCGNDVPECKKGCCLPVCEDNVTKIQCTGDYMAFGGDWRDVKCQDVNECEKGCCQDEGEYIDNVAQAFCLRTQGNTWNKGECGKGFFAKVQETGKMEITGTRAMGSEIGSSIDKMLDKQGMQRELTWKVDLDAYTCNEILESEWHMILTIDIVNNGTQATPQSFFIDFGKQKSYSMEASFMGWSNKFYEIALEENRIKIQFDTHMSDKPVVVYVPIQKGAEACKKKG